MMKKIKKRKRSRPSGGARKNTQVDSLNAKKVREKLNIPPSNPGVQDVPRSLKEFIKLKELANESSKKINVKKRQTKVKNDTSKILGNNSEKVDPHRTATMVKNEPFEDLNVQSEHDRRFRSKLVNIKKKRKLKLEKLKLKRKLKKDQKKKEIEEDGSSIVKEVIKFGEVVHRPPHLSTLPRQVSKTGYENRPGRKDDLLLKSILKRDRDDSYNSQSCAKRKYLSVSDQRQLEAEKNKAVLMYKNLKMKRAKMKSK